MGRLYLFAQKSAYCAPGERLLSFKAMVKTPLLALLLAAAPLARAAELAAPEISARAEAWRGYVASFPSPLQAPALSGLGVELKGDAQVEAFSRVMARAGVSPEALRGDLSAQQQAALVAAAASDYGRGLAARADALSDDAPPAPGALTALGAEFGDLSAVSALIPPEQLASLAFGHGKIERLAAREEGLAADAVQSRVERVGALWSGEKADPSVEASAETTAKAGWRLRRSVPGAPEQSPPPRVIPSPGRRSVLGSVVSAPLKAARGALGFVDMIWNGIFPPAVPKNQRVGSPGSGRILAVVTEGDPVLTNPAAAVEPAAIPTKEFQRFLDDMVRTMGSAGGVGLAAPQVGRGQRVAVVRFRGEPLIMINPKLTVLNERTNYHLEGCLSISGECAFVPRPSRIKVEYLDRLGRAQSLTLSRFQSVIVQHELDHLDGVLFTMRSARFLKKFGLGGVRGLSRSARVELARWASNLSDPQRVSLSLSAEQMSRDFYDATEPGTLTASLSEGLGLASEEDLFREALAYHEIMISPQSPDKKALALKSWIKSGAHALFAYGALSESKLPDASAVFRALRMELPDMALLNNPHLRGPPFESPKTIVLRDQVSGKDAEIEFPTVDLALEAAVLAEKYGLVKTKEGFRLKFVDSDAAVFVTVKTIETALLAARVKEASPQTRALDLALPSGPSRGVGWDQNKPLSFGLESELNIRENPNLVDDYRLHFFSEEAWLGLSREDRIRVARDEEEKRHHKGDPFLKKLSGAPKALPARLLAEGDGNCEMNGMVFSTFDELRAFVGYLDERYGPSSLQGHVAYKNHDALEGVAGWVVFEADAAQLKTLEKNFERYLTDPKVTPGKNLSHHSLGPLGEDDRKLFLRFEARARKGKRVGEPGNSRITYAPVFRDDIYPEGVRGHEFRQFHKRSAELLAAMDDFSSYLQNSGDLSPFAPFAEQRLISARLPAERAKALGLPIEKRAWAKFFSAAGDFIDGKHPTLVKGGAHLSERFFFPLRDWGRHPVVEGLPEPLRSQTRERVEQATRAFLLEAGAIVSDYQKRSVDDQALRQLQIASARWASEARLGELMAEFRQRTLAAVGSRGPPTLAHWPGVLSTRAVPKDAILLDELPFESAAFPDGRRYLRYKMAPKFDERSEAYRRFRDSSVEVLYQSAMPYGHVNLRVGRRLYGLKYVEEVTLADFSPGRVGKGKTGFVFMVDPARIKEIQGELEKLFASSSANNLPPFDAESPELKIVRQKNGGLKFKSPFMVFANNKEVRAELIELNGEAFLKTSDGFTYPVTKKGEDYCTQSLACATSATYVMRKYFEIPVDFQHGAKSLRDDLAVGNPKGRAPDAIVDY
jgi:peptide deformylase